jgi:hypothetical protein
MLLWYHHFFCFTPYHVSHQLKNTSMSPSSYRRVYQFRFCLQYFAFVTSNSHGHHAFDTPVICWISRRHRLYHHEPLVSHFFIARVSILHFRLSLPHIDASQTVSHHIAFFSLNLALFSSLPELFTPVAQYIVFSGHAWYVILYHNAIPPKDTLHAAIRLPFTLVNIWAPPLSSTGLLDLFNSSLSNGRRRFSSGLRYHTVRFQPQALFRLHYSLSGYYRWRVSAIVSFQITGRRPQMSLAVSSNSHVCAFIVQLSFFNNTTGRNGYRRVSHFQLRPSHMVFLYFSWAVSLKWGWRHFTDISCHHFLIIFLLLLSANRHSLSSGLHWKHSRYSVIAFSRRSHSS